jgi:Flp pilus assembly protein TadG
MSMVRAISRLSVFARARGSADRFVRADGGNVAITFAIAILPILAFVGAAIDYSRANNARTAMQAALDSAALMISKDATTLTAAQLTTKAQSYFTALYTHTEAPSVSFTATYTQNTGSGSTVLLTGSGTMPTEFMKLVGFPTLNFNVNSTAKWGTTRLRVALALDNTGSMSQDGKISALQTASKNLIDQLSALAKNPGDVYISIVPFAKDVNVGSSNYAATWLTDWTTWGAEPATLQSSKPSGWSNVGPGSSCPFGNYTFGCMTGPATYQNTNSVPSSGSYKGYICPGDDYTTFSYYNGCYSSVKSGNSYTHTWTANAQSTWNGCVTDRTQPYDTQNTAPTSASTYFTVEQYDACPTALMALSYDWTGLKAKIDAMTPNGGTNQPIGLAWAWQSLTQTAPLNAPAFDPNYTYNSIIILLSDGLNTQDRWPAYGNGNTQFNGQIDARQKLLCDNVKAAGITIYTIQVNTGTPADPTSAVLQYCASGSDKFFLLTSSSQVVTTFNSIGTSLSKLRIAQ